MISLVNIQIQKSKYPNILSWYAYFYPIYDHSKLWGDCCIDPLLTYQLLIICIVTLNTTYIVRCYLLVDFHTRNIYVHIYTYICTLVLFKTKLEPGRGIVSGLRLGARANLIASKNWLLYALSIFSFLCCYFDSIKWYVIFECYYFYEMIMQSEFQKNQWRNDTFVRLL